MLEARGAALFKEASGQLGGAPGRSGFSSGTWSWSGAALYTFLLALGVLALVGLGLAAAAAAAGTGVGAGSGLGGGLGSSAAGGGRSGVGGGGGPGPSRAPLGAAAISGGAHWERAKVQAEAGAAWAADRLGLARGAHKTKVN